MQKPATWLPKRKAKSMQRPTRQRLTLTAALTLCALSVSACAPKPLAVAIKPPPELLTCADEPAAPTLPAHGIERDRIVGDWLLAYRAAWGSCKSAVVGLKSWSDALPD